MSNHCRVLFDQPIDDFNGLNFIEIISEDGGDNDLIVSKITLKDIDHNYCLQQLWLEPGCADCCSMSNLCLLNRLPDEGT